MTSETDEQFVERMRNASNYSIKTIDLDRLFALARRGAAVQTVGHLDDGKTAILKAAGLHQTSAKILEQAAEINRLRAAMTEAASLASSGAPYINNTIYAVLWAALEEEP